VNFAKATLGEAVSDVRTSDRLTESAVCLVAAEHGPDRQLQKMLQGAGRIESAAKPVLEINPGHALITALAGYRAEDRAFREDAARLLLDQARVLDGDKPEDPRAFAERLSRVFHRALKD
jgi:molecular chaperone HtpG